MTNEQSNYEELKKYLEVRIDQLNNEKCPATARKNS